MSVQVGCDVSFVFDKVLTMVTKVVLIAFCIGFSTTRAFSYMFLTGTALKQYQIMTGCVLYYSVTGLAFSNGLTTLVTVCLWTFRFVTIYDTMTGFASFMFCLCFSWISCIYHGIWFIKFTKWGCVILGVRQYVTVLV